MKNPLVELIAIDLDGTLYAMDLLISERNRLAIAAARDAGIRVTLATGRVVYDVVDRVRELGLLPPNLPASQVTPIISYQGGVVYDLLTERPLLVQHLDAALAIRVIRLLRRLGQSVNMHTLTETYRENARPLDTMYAEKSRLVQPHDVPDLVAAISAQGLQPLKIVIVNEPDANHALIEMLRAEFGSLVEVTRSHSYFCEVTSLSATKGVALAFLAQQLGIARERVMAIGDNWNDVSMLHWAGYGVAMGHADEQVKAAASYVTETLANDGVAHAIERLALGEVD